MKTSCDICSCRISGRYRSKGGNMMILASLLTLLVFHNGGNGFAFNAGVSRSMCEKLRHRQREGFLTRTADWPRESKPNGDNSDVRAPGGSPQQKATAMTAAAAGVPEPGLSWLVEERDACGVGFIANPGGKSNHRVVDLGLIALKCMEHRGACLADNVSGDGSGIMTAVPWDLVEREFAVLGVAVESLPSRAHRAVGMMFMPRREKDAAACRETVEATMRQSGLTFHGWRKVPIDPSYLGPLSRDNQPGIEQFLLSSDTASGDNLEREIYLLRRMASKKLNDQGLNWRADTYICSLSTRTIVYKGMTNSNALGNFYKDLTDPEFSSNFCVYHRRFSTNTEPKWPLAQPMRMLGHNGEINTLLGNLNWFKAREGGLDADCEFDPDGDTQNFINHCDIQDDNFEALVDNGKSDSANLDSVVELLVQSTKSPKEALMLMVPEAFRSQPALKSRPEVKDFYSFWEGQQEAWDGPALLVWSDGKHVGACLDRNGLRPARFMTLKDGTVLMMSETGVVPVDESQVMTKGRLGPGQMIACNLATGEFENNWSIKQKIAARHPYGDWLRAHSKRVDPLPFTAEGVTKEDILIPQTYFGWSSEDVDMQIADMARTGKESTFCMGDDIPLAVMSEQPHVLYDYFKQRFAQVTNPPIDPLREGTVMSLEMNLGARGNVMDPKPEDARQVKISSPVLNAAELRAVEELPGFATVTLRTLFALDKGPEGLHAAVEALTSEAVAAVEAGADILVLSDRTEEALSSDQTYISPLLAVGATHHALINAGVRMKVSLVVETGQAWSTHHFACLVGYGASAVHPYLAYQSVQAWWALKKTQVQIESGQLPKITAQGAQANFRKAIDAGILKIMSKMGISLLSSYQGAQIFEAVGIGEGLLNLGFKGTPSRLGGLETHDLACETASFMEKAFEDDGPTKLTNYGYVQFYRSGEYHHNSPLLMKTLHKAIKAEDYSMYDLYMQSLRSRPVTTLRDLLDFKGPGRRATPIPLEEVEPAESIMKRFCTGAMSLGALSREAHETLAVALNRIGGKSNSGEGGEDPIRFAPIEDVSEDSGVSASFPHLKELRNGDFANSAIKQIASGRFGVTPEYLVSAKQTEIKMAQGAKPGEGGQLPGSKVSEYIASVRASKPGVTLISPPPHHDIYSIEDLAQLIFDLHQIAPKTAVSVKLVSEVGIGTVAAGVAKANADVIQISGHDGGTGASPLSSIKHAGSPWELGLAEVHRTLLQNGLRDRVLLRTDGGIKTGWDVVIAALMGAEEFGFGTISMIAEGCIMARICHTNNCPVGVATQKEELRKKFPGTPQNVVTFFEFVAEEVRLLLAELGFRSLEEAVGRADVLSARTDVFLTKTGKALNLDFITSLPDVSLDRSWLHHEQAHSNGPVLDDEILADPAVKSCLENASKLTKDFPIDNTDRSVGGRLSGIIASRWGNKGFQAAGGELELRFTGSAGQSFGAFNLPGVSLRLEGEANDYVGKGINGGELVIVPPSEAGYEASENVIIGNTCLYGATGGALFANGRAGERFAVRNSMADAVVEGTGDHCCEYMTGGNVVVLGTVGRNVGAGMTGGVAYILDEFPHDEFMEHINLEIVRAQRVLTPEGEAVVKGLIERHVELTGSPKGKYVLNNWKYMLPRFWQIVPPAEANIAATNQSISEAKAKTSETARVVSDAAVLV